MDKERIDVLELLRKRGMDGDVDFLREVMRVLVDSIMDAEVSAQIGAEHGERSPDRITHRNGYRTRSWDTRVGILDLHIPKIREGSYFPTLLDPRRRSERALVAVIQQAYPPASSGQARGSFHPESGRPGQGPGLRRHLQACPEPAEGSQVSRICQELDEVVESLLGRYLGDYAYPYLWLDAPCPRRSGKQVASSRSVS